MRIWIMATVHSVHAFNSTCSKNPNVQSNIHSSMQQRNVYNKQKPVGYFLGGGGGGGGENPTHCRFLARNLQCVGKCRGGVRILHIVDFPGEFYYNYKKSPGGGKFCGGQSTMNHRSS